MEQPNRRAAAIAATAGLLLAHYVVALRPVNLPDSSYGYRLLYQSSRRKLWMIEM